MINVIQTEIEGSAVGHSRSTVCIAQGSVRPPIAKVQNKIGGVTSETVGRNLKRITFEINCITTIDDRVPESKIVLAQSRLCGQ